jgi:hypothetical protein
MRLIQSILEYVTSISLIEEIAECRGLSGIPTEFKIYISTGPHLEARDK